MRLEGCFKPPRLFRRDDAVHIHFLQQVSAFQLVRSTILEDFAHEALALRPSSFQNDTHGCVVEQRDQLLLAHGIILLLRDTEVQLRGLREITPRVRHLRAAHLVLQENFPRGSVNDVCRATDPDVRIPVVVDL